LDLLAYLCDNGPALKKARAPVLGKQQRFVFMKDRMRAALLPTTEFCEVWGRFSLMKSRIILASMAVTLLAMVFAVRAQEGPAQDIAKVKDDLRLREQILARQFAEFENALLRLKDRLKRSNKLEDKQRAEILEKVLEQAKDASISVKFEQMVDMLKTSKLSSIGDLKILDDQSRTLADELRRLLDLMREDPRSSKLRDERLALEELIKRIEKLIHEQKIVQGQTDRAKTDPKELKENQNKVTQATGKVAKDVAKKTDKGGEAKNTKGEAKEGGKDGKKGESKDAGQPGGDKKGKAKDDGGKPAKRRGPMPRRATPRQVRPRRGARSLTTRRLMPRGARVRKQNPARPRPAGKSLMPSPRRRKPKRARRAMARARPRTAISKARPSRPTRKMTISRSSRNSLKITSPTVKSKSRTLNTR
jgi:hypothetical protein